jgi:hypothetical protein
VDRQVRQQRKSEWNRKRAVHGVGGLADPKGVRELKRLVAQEGETCSKARLEGRLNIGRVNGYDRYAAVSDFSGLMELDQFRQLKPSLGSPRASEEGDNQGRARGQILDGNRLVAVVYETYRGKLLTDFVLECHRCLL